MKQLNIKYILCVIAIISSFHLSAQINIGSLKPAAKAALLQIKEIEPNDNDGQTVSTGGIILPRVKLTSTGSLEPAVSTSQIDYTTQKLLHVGMMVFNLSVDQSAGLQKGVYVWTGDEWQYILSISTDLDLNVNPSEVVFASGLDGQIIQSENILINWLPLVSDCFIEKKNILNGGVDITTTIPSTVSGGSESLNFDVLPLKQSDIDNDTFFEKQSNLIFTVSDGSESKSESVTIRQIHYNMIVNGFEELEHDLGRTYTAQVRTNGNWKVTLGGDVGLIESYSPSSASANIIGDKFTYKLTDNDNYEGKSVTFTFSNIDGKHADQTFTVRGVREYPNSYFIKPGDNFEFPIRKAYQVWENNLGTNITGNLTAELLWQDRKSLITGVQLNGSGANATITINTNTGTTQETLKEYVDYPTDVTIITTSATIPYIGNAVVAIKEDGVIRWSWHLWITDYNPDAALSHNFAEGVSDSLAVDGGTVYSYFNSSKNTILMDRPLGGVSLDPRAENIKGYLFQWGRKDPIPTYQLRNYSLPQELFTLNNISLVENLNGFIKEVVSNTEGRYLEKSIMNPMVIYLGNTENSYDWYGGKIGLYDNYLWSTSDGKKALYDPCPEGWRIPEGTFETNSPWYNLPVKEEFDTVTPSTIILDYRDQGYGIEPLTGSRIETTAAFSSGHILWHSRSEIVVPLAYSSEIVKERINPGIPQPRAASASVRCIRDENTTK